MYAIGRRPTAVEYEESLALHVDHRGEPLIKNPLDLQEGYLPVPTGPGLGVELDWDEVEKRTESMV